AAACAPASMLSHTVMALSPASTRRVILSVIRSSGIAANDPNPLNVPMLSPPNAETGDRRVRSVVGGMIPRLASCNALPATGMTGRTMHELCTWGSALGSAPATAQHGRVKIDVRAQPNV